MRLLYRFLRREADPWLIITPIAAALFLLLRWLWFWG